MLRVSFESDSHLWASNLKQLNVNRFWSPISMSSVFISSSVEFPRFTCALYLWNVLFFVFEWRHTPTAMPQAIEESLRTKNKIFLTRSDQLPEKIRFDRELGHYGFLQLFFFGRNKTKWSLLFNLNTGKLVFNFLIYSNKKILW